MFRITKLTDYALVILTEMQEEVLISAKTLSQKTNIPLATTNKILKSLVAHHLCISKSGKTGGFLLAQAKNKISLLRIIQAIEGEDKNLTDCQSVKDGKTCSIKHSCKISHKMTSIDKEIHELLGNRFLNELS